MLTYNNFETTDWIDAQCPVYEEDIGNDLINGERKC